MKYSPGFDDPSARPRLARKGRLVLAALVGVGLMVLALLTGAVLDLEAAISAGAEWLGLR